MELSNADLQVSLTGKPTESSRSRRWRYMKQALIVANASQWFIQMAMLGAWLNPAIYDFKKIGTNFYGEKVAYTETELDMLSSLSSIGSLLGCLYAWPVSWWGRRFTLIILVVPHIITWALLGLAPTPGWMLFGKILSGFASGAASLSVNTYMVEIPDVAIRGTIAMLSQLLISIGYLIAVTLGLVFRYFHFMYLGVTTSIIACVLNFFLPESPTFLVTKNREDEARRVLKSLRSPDHDVELELEMLRNENRGMEESSFVSVLRQPAILKSLFIVLGLFVIQHFSGIYICYINTSRIFIETGTNMNENMAVVFTFIFQFLGTVGGSFTVDKLGRRFSIILSGILVTVFLYIMATYTFMFPNNDAVTNSTGAIPIVQTFMENATQISAVNVTSSSSSSDIPSNDWNWVPLMCMMGVCFSASLGVESVPWILSAEYFPTSIRAKAQSITVAHASLLSMLVFGVYSPMKQALSIPGLYIFYATCSFAGFIFNLIFVRETAGQDIG